MYAAPIEHGLRDTYREFLIYAMNFQSVSVIVSSCAAQFDGEFTTTTPWIALPSCSAYTEPSNPPPTWSSLNFNS
ncbi:hypothetical protein VTN49DRAFT_5137 [Thermomyces lanuginosus]|uniref:uncharacterized protein n=1 Tax=Thermomyces lanuginosus TaxID=5541 RepID=UPI0037445C82